MTVSINLLPWREELKELRKKEFFVMLGSAGVLFALIIVAFHLVFVSKIDFQRAKNNFLKQEISQLDKQIAQIEGLQKEKEKLLNRMEIIQRLQSNRPHIVRLFDVFARTVPDGLFLINLTRAEGRVLIEGKAESNTRVSKFMRNIESSKWLFSPILSFIQADKAQQGQSDLVSKENLIGFNMQVLERNTMDVVE